MLCACACQSSCSSCSAKSSGAAERRCARPALLPLAFSGLYVMLVIVCASYAIHIRCCCAEMPR
jgi:hypothetical protein